MGVFGAEELEGYLRERRGRLAAHLEGEEARGRERIERAIAALRKRRFNLYMRLVAPYLSDRPEPELVERWREGTGAYVSARLALADHTEAVLFMLECLEEGCERGE